MGPLAAADAQARSEVAQVGARAEVAAAGVSRGLLGMWSPCIRLRGAHTFPLDQKPSRWQR